MSLIVLGLALAALHVFHLRGIWRWIYVLTAAFALWLNSFVGVVQAFPAAGCGKPLCKPRWTGINFGFGFESSPAIAGGVVFVAKGPASGVPVDAGVAGFAIGTGFALIENPAL